MSRGEPVDASTRPSLAPAIVGGGLAMLVALLTGAFQWLTRPAPEPPAPAPTLAVAAVSASEPIRTAFLSPEESSPQAAFRAEEDLAPWSFIDFQSTVKDPAVDPQVRQRILDECVGRKVMWEGYVDAVLPLPPGADAAWTVLLCEEERLLSQSLLKRPAICRFDADEAAGVAQLRRGQRVTIHGDCTDHSPRGTIVLHCRLQETSLR
jgi:hypothetical protein